MSPSASDPKISPTVVKTIAPVIGVPAIRPEIAANPSSVSVTTTSAQCIRSPYLMSPPLSIRPMG